MQLAFLEKQLPKEPRAGPTPESVSSYRSRLEENETGCQDRQVKIPQNPIGAVCCCLLHGQQTETAQLLLEQAHSPQKSKYQKATVKRKPSSATVFAEEEPKYRHEPTDQVCQGTPGLSPPLCLIEGDDFSQSPQAVVTLHASNTAANLC